MSKSSPSRIKRLFSNIFKIKSWLDLERIQSGFQYVKEQASTYFIPGTSKATESFEQAKTRLKLSDDDLLVREKGLLRLSVIMMTAAIFIFIYSMYNLFYGYYAALLVSVVLNMLALVMAFRYHFWYFQIKNKRLGCSLHEWFMQGILGVKDE